MDLQDMDRENGSLPIRLIKLALAGKGKHKFAACCTDKHGRILSYATNSYTKTHPAQLRAAKAAGCEEKRFLHAEIAALVKCRERPYKIQVVRVSKAGELRLAKPCSVCQLAIREAGVKFVEYST